MRLRTSNRALAACAAAILGLAGCSVDEGADGSGAVALAGTGKVTLVLNFAGATDIGTVTFRISGADFGEVGGQFNIGKVPNGTVTTVLDPVPAGFGRTITLTASTSTGAFCEGAVTLDVVPNDTTEGNLTFSCTGVTGATSPETMEGNAGMAATGDAASEDAADMGGETTMDSAPVMMEPAGGATMMTDEPAMDMPMDASMDMPMDTSMDASVEMPTDEPDDMEMPTDEPDDMEMPTDEPDDMEMPTDEPDDMEMPTDEPTDEPDESGIANLVGAWLTPPLVFETSMTAPFGLQGPAKITQTMIARILADGTSTAQICTLEFEEEVLGLQFVDSVQAIQATATTLSDVEVAVGAPFPVESVELAASNMNVSVERPIPVPELAVNVGVDITLQGVVTDETTVSGTASFTSTSASALGDVVIPESGEPPSADFEMKKVSDDPDISCEEAAALLQ